MSNPKAPAEQVTERKFYLDILKIVATFGVIFLHVFAKGFYGSLNTCSWYVAVVGDSLVRWSVPIFVMISGVLFLDPLKDLSVSTIIRKYVKRLLLAYVFWYVVYCLFNFVLIYLSDDSSALGYNFFKPAYHLWFLPMLMGVYLLVPILRRVVGDIRLLIYTLTLWGVYVTIGFVLIRDISQLSSLFRMNIVVGYAGYFLLGYFLSLDRLSKHQRSALYVFGLLGAVITVAGSIVISLSLGVAYDRFLHEISPQVLMMSAALFVCVMRQSPNIKCRLIGFTDYVRKDLFGIYLVHIIWLEVFYRIFLSHICNHGFSYVLFSLLIFLFSFYTTRILRKVPFIARFVE